MRTFAPHPTTPTPCTAQGCGKVATVQLVERDELYGSIHADPMCRWCALDAARRMDAPRSVEDAIHSISDQSADVEAAERKVAAEAKAAKEAAEYADLEAQYAAERAAAAEADDEEEAIDPRWQFLRAIGVAGGIPAKRIPEYPSAGTPAAEPKSAEAAADGPVWHVSVRVPRVLGRGWAAKGGGAETLLEIWNGFSDAEKPFHLAIFTRRGPDGPWEAYCTVYRGRVEDGSTLYEVRPQAGQSGEAVRGQDLGTVLPRFVRIAREAVRAKNAAAAAAGPSRIERDWAAARERERRESIHPSAATASTPAQPTEPNKAAPWGRTALGTPMGPPRY